MNDLIEHTIGFSVNITENTAALLLRIAKRESSQVIHSVFKGWYHSYLFWFMTVGIILVLVLTLIYLVYKISRKGLEISQFFYQCCRIRRLLRKEDTTHMTRVKSSMYYDEYGPYLKHKHYRIYHNGDSSTTEPLKVVSGKESKLVSSDIEEVGSIPKFIGQFKVGNDVVGHFSRVLYEGRDCLLTAMHVS